MSDSRVPKAAAAALALVGAGSAANATTVIDVPLSAVLGSGESYDGSFDISSFLSGGDYEITSATLDLSGYSSFGQTGTAFAGYYTYAYTAYAPYYYSYSCGWFSTCYGVSYYAYTAYATAPYYAPVDQVQDHLTLSAGTGSTTSYDGPQGSPTSYYGNIVAQLFVGADALATANSTGALDFVGLAFTNSSIYLTDAKLSFELAPVVGAVPEPATWAMLLIGFAAVGGAVRAKRRRSSRVALA